VRKAVQKIFDTSASLLNKVVDIQQFIANIFLVFMMAIITLDVIGRNFFHSPLKGTYEMTELTSALLVFFAFAITHRYEEHITIDFLVEKFSVRMQHIFNGVIEIVITILLFLMARHIFDNGVRMMERGATTTDLSIPVYPILFIITFTLIVFGLTALLKAINHFRGVVDPQ
jgi:TRAP-type C4-dicarboxylate transport system permease small subunit